MANFSHDWPEFPQAVALGLVPGFRALRKFGRNDDIDGNEEMWEYGTARVLPTSAGVVSVVSSSAADDGSPAGTGAWSVVVEGLDADYNEISETVTLNGISAVTTTASFFRINRAYVFEAGSGGVNAGNIDLTIGGNEQAFIEADEGQTHQTHYTVPAGHSLVVTGISLAMGRGSGDLVVESQVKVTALSADAAWRSISAIDLVSGSVYNTQNSIGEILPEKTEIRQVCKYAGTNAEVSGIFHGYLVNNEHLAKL